MNQRSANLDDIKLLHHAGKLNEARQGYLSLLQTNPKDLDVLHLLGLLCAEEGQLEDARKYLQQACDLAPDNSAVRLHLANIFKATGNYDEAVKELQAMIAADETCAPAFNNLGTVYFARKNYAAAVQAFHAALDIRPDYIDAYYNLGLAQARLNDSEAAMLAYRAIIAITPEHAGAHFQLGSHLMKRRQFAEATKEFSHVSEEHPHHFESLANLAACCLGQGRIDQAAASYLRALELVPEDREILFNLGVIYMQQGYPHDAIKFYHRAVKSHPDFFDAHHNLAAVYLMRRDHDHALEHFREALRIEPNHEALRHTIRILTQDPELRASSPEYIKSLFDSYADYYDAHLRTHLHYRVPEKLYAVVASKVDLPAATLNILDLGCGTGLCGGLLKPHAAHLIGVDLSENMLAAADAKQIYNELIAADAVDYLTAHAGEFDLVMAGDVLVYFGELEELVNAAWSALKPSGYFAFNVEVGRDGDYTLTPSGRFAHHQTYLDSLARTQGFLLLAMEQDTIRSQQDGPVPGYLCLWQRPAVI